MNDAGMVAVSRCIGGCGEPMAFGEGPCEDCVRFAQHYERLERMYARRAAHLPATAKESAHLGAVEQAARRGVFTFLGWKTPAASAKVGQASIIASPLNHNMPAASAERVQAESETAPEAGDGERRSELLAKLPRVECGVRRMCALPRMELWHSDVPLCMVAVVLAWDVLRWAGCCAMDSVARCLASRRLRGRLALTAMVLGIALGLAASVAAWGMR